jgi:hypothetical protein
VTKIKCPIWGTIAATLDGYQGADGDAINSERAGGKYFISRTASAMLNSIDDMQRVALTHEICDHNALGSILEISSTTLKTLPLKPRFPAQERADRLLTYLISRSEHLGHKIKTEHDHTGYNVRNFSLESAETIPIEKEWLPFLAWSNSLKIDEVIFLLDMLSNSGLIQKTTQNSRHELIVLPQGYTYSDSVNHQSGTDQAFVAMWFDQSVSDAYENGIEAALRECGYSPMRIDRKEHNNKIDDEIIAEIKRSKFIVADFTSEPDKPRGEVYFEAGYAMGMGIPVVWTCREDLIDQLHFDTQQFNHIVWKAPTDLAEKLKKRILATIGQGPIQK